MNAEDKLIIHGIITVLACLAFITLLTFFLEKRIASKKTRWLLYFVLLGLGLLTVSIFPLPSKNASEFVIRIPSLIGLCFSVLIPVAFITVMIFKIDGNMIKILTEKAKKTGKELNMQVHGIPHGKIALSELHFYFTGMIKNEWPVSHYEDYTMIKSTKTIKELNQNPNDRHYNYRNVYKFTLKRNSTTSVVLLPISSQNDYGYNQLGYQRIKTRYIDFNEIIAVYAKSDETNCLELLQDHSIRKLLISHSELLKLGLVLNHESGTGYLMVDVKYPEYGIFELGITKKIFTYQLDQKKEQLNFLSKFLTYFDNTAKNEFK